MDCLTLSNKFFESSLYTTNLQLHNNFGESRERSAAGLVLRVRRGACGGSSGVGGGGEWEGMGSNCKNSHSQLHNINLCLLNNFRESHREQNGSRRKFTKNLLVRQKIYESKKLH